MQRRIGDGGGGSASGIDYRLLVPLFLHAVAVQSIVAMVRVTTSYRALELELPVIWLGIISGTFALLPVFLSVWVGRYVDRGNDARSVWIGSAFLLAGCWGLRSSPPSAYHLLLFTAVLGVGHMFMMVGQQVVCVRAADARGREAVFGNFMLANALGHGIGPMIVGWLGGAATIPPTRQLFAIAMVMSAVAVLIAVAIRPAAGAAGTAREAPAVPLAGLLRIRGVPTLLMASVITVTAQDLITVYLPLLGAERGIDVATIGLLLMVRSGAAVVSRLIYAPLIRLAGRTRLTIATIVLSAACYLCLALPLPMWAMHVAISGVGFGLGIAATLSISNIVDMTPASARGIVVSLRITGNRIGQMTMPLAAGLVAAAAGAAGIFVIVAGSLAAMAVAMRGMSRWRVDT